MTGDPITRRGRLVGPVLICALVLCASWAQAVLPDYDTCMVSWEFSGVNVYQQTTQDGPSIQVSRIPVAPTWRGFVPCPTAQGTYYYYVRGYNDLGQEGVKAGVVGFTIKGGALVPVLAVGGKAQISALNLLNVRSYTPGAGGATGVIGAVPLGTQKTGTTAIIIGGPVTVPFGSPQVPTTFWQLDFPTGVDGWCSEVFLVPIP